MGSESRTRGHGVTSSSLGPSIRQIETAFTQAYVAAKTRRPRWLTEDDVQDGAAKWWRRLTCGTFPGYLLRAGEISVELLAWWIVQSATEIGAARQKRVRALAESGVETGSPLTEGVDQDIADHRSRTVEEAVVGRLDAKERLAGLGKVSEIDAVVRYRAFGFSYDEVADRLDITANAARVRMLRARTRLASKLRAA